MCGASSCLPRCWRKFLETFEGTLLVISHDRYFLDKVVDRVVDLDPERGILEEYDGGYTDYLALKMGASGY